MGFADAVRSVLSNYAGFSGRARRSEYWWWTLFVVLVYVVAVVVDTVLGVSAVTIVAVFALLVPSLAVTTRRLHDTDRSGWWQLLAFVPFGGIVILVWCCSDSKPDTNQHGPSPKLVAA